MAPRRRAAVVVRGTLRVTQRGQSGINATRSHPAGRPVRHKVEVSAQKVVGKTKQKGFSAADEEIELSAEMIPEWYNTKTELSEEIKPGPNTVKLDLKSTR